MAFALTSRTDGLVCSAHTSQETNGTSLELENIFMIAVLLLSPRETLHTPKYWKTAESIR